MRKRSRISPDVLCMLPSQLFPLTASKLSPLLSFLPSCSIFALRVRFRSKQPILAPYLLCGWTRSRWGRGAQRQPCFLRTFVGAGPENPAEVMALMQVSCAGMLPIPGAPGGKRGRVPMHMAHM